MQSGELLEFVDRLSQPRVMVVGDLILDSYVWGDAERISQEAPVPILRVRSGELEYRLGGAGSVCANLIALGARVQCAGIVGRDADGSRLIQELRDAGVETDSVLELDDRPTTSKQRFMGRAQHRHPQQMLRVDYEQTAPIDSRVAARILQRIEPTVGEFDIILVSDYDKGVCTEDLLQSVVAAARAASVRVLVDPVPGGDYRRYRGASCITPNRLEAQRASGLDIRQPDDAVLVGQQFCRDLELEAAVITLDRDGMCLVTAEGQAEVFPARPRQVYDITGAGDMVLSAVGLALAGGGTFAEAVQLANVAGGLEVEKIGAATVTRDEIRHDLLASRQASRSKICGVDWLLTELKRRRDRGHSIVFTNGCFDLLHVGHMRYLQAARALGDCLVVGLNSDRSVREIKGPTRPLNDQAHRAEVLAGSEAVDYVIIFDEATPMSLIQEVRPDMLVKGSDWAEKGVVGSEFVESYGGRVDLVDIVPGISTTELIERIRREQGNSEG